MDFVFNLMPEWAFIRMPEQWLERMPDWWVEVTLPSLVFGSMLILWIIIPPKKSEEDLASKFRYWITNLFKK